MFRTKRARLVAALAGVVLLAIGALAVFIAFEYTWIPTVREQFADVEEGVTEEYGALLFETRGCAGCHRISREREEPTLGPNLADIALRSTAGNIRESIVDPRAVIAEGCEPEPCPPTLMPEYGSILREVQIDALVAFLLSRGSQ